MTVCRKPASVTARDAAKQTTATGLKPFARPRSTNPAPARPPPRPPPAIQARRPSRPLPISAPGRRRGISQALVDQTVVTLSASDRSLTLNQSEDYIVECPSGQFDVPGKITIWGGHNVVFQDLR